MLTATTISRNVTTPDSWDRLSAFLRDRHFIVTAGVSAFGIAAAIALTAVSPDALSALALLGN
jgi:hypothetical protein